MDIMMACANQQQNIYGSLNSKSTHQHSSSSPPSPQEFSSHLGFLFSLIIATPWWVQLIHSNPQCGASGRVQNSVEKLKCLTLFRVSHSWSLYFIICHVELWFRKCKLNRGHNPQAQMYQLKFTYRIYSNKRPTSNKRPRRISAHPKGRKS